MDKIGPYEILETLHLGSQPLYRAKAADGRIVAVKTIPVKGLSEEMRERFIREGETCRALDHPNLVRVFDCGEAGGFLYQAMELLDGSDLGKVFGQNRKFTWEEKLSIMEQVCEGLQYAHDHKLVHRDIKPANLFLENSGRVRVVDFGMVRVEESDLTKAGTSVGTLNYMSPEQIRGERCTTATDIFSAGIVFYQLASGQHPFSKKDRSLVQVVSAIVFETPASLGTLCPDAPEGLEFILNKTLEKDPLKRIQNGGDLKQAMALCRITMRLGNTGSSPAGGETKMMPSAGQGGAGASAPSGAQIDPEKTRVMRRSTPATPVAPPPAPPPPPKPAAPAPPPFADWLQSAPPAQPRPAQPLPNLTYCPSCTTANPPGATICRACGNPLGGRAPVQTKAPTSWGLYLAIGAAVLLAIALIVVLIVK